MRCLAVVAFVLFATHPLHVFGKQRGARSGHELTEQNSAHLTTASPLANSVDDVLLELDARKGIFGLSKRFRRLKQRQAEMKRQREEAQREEAKKEAQEELDKQDQQCMQEREKWLERARTSGYARAFVQRFPSLVQCANADEIPDFDTEI